MSFEISAAHPSSMTAIVARAEFVCDVLGRDASLVAPIAALEDSRDTRAITRAVTAFCVETGAEPHWLCSGDVRLLVKREAERIADLKRAWR